MKKNKSRYFMVSVEITAVKKIIQLQAGQQTQGVQERFMENIFFQLASGIFDYIMIKSMIAKTFEQQGMTVLNVAILHVFELTEDEFILAIAGASNYDRVSKKITEIAKQLGIEDDYVRHKTLANGLRYLLNAGREIKDEELTKWLEREIGYILHDNMDSITN